MSYNINIIRLFSSFEFVFDDILIISLIRFFVLIVVGGIGADISGYGIGIFRCDFGFYFYYRLFVSRYYVGFVVD